jgi:hypothetical protein
MKLFTHSTTAATSTQHTQTESIPQPAAPQRLAETLRLIRADSRSGSEKYLEDSVAHYGGE